MKYLLKLFGTQSRRLCAIALAVLIGFSFAACGGSSPSDDPDDTLVISGTLSSANQFRASVRSAGGISRAAAPEAESQTFSVELGSDNKTLSGKLKDGSITFELSGQYDAATKVFSVQAPSSLMIFSIVGKLNANDTIDTASTSASVKVKDSTTGEWTSIDLAVTPSDQTVEGEANADTDDVSFIPAYCQGTFTDQIMAQIGVSLKYMVTQNSITMLDGDNPPQDFTVVEITNADGTTPANEDGPWHLIIRGKWYVGDEPTDYTGKFYVGKEFTPKLTTDIGSAPVSDLLPSIPGGEEDDTTLSEAVLTLSGIKMFVVPYCANANVSTGGIDPDDGYSPLFTGAEATANAKDEDNILKAKRGFTLALK